VYVDQLASRLVAQDLGYFFEDKLGRGTVRDVRIIRNKG
jgi:RNA-binding protein 39